MALDATVHGRDHLFVEGKAPDQLEINSNYFYRSQKKVATWDHQNEEVFRKLSRIYSEGDLIGLMVTIRVILDRIIFQTDLARFTLLNIFKEPGSELSKQYLILSGKPEQVTYPHMVSIIDELIKNYQFRLEQKRKTGSKSKNDASSIFLDLIDEHLENQRRKAPKCKKVPNNELMSCYIQERMNKNPLHKDRDISLLRHIDEAIKTGIRASFFMGAQHERNIRGEIKKRYSESQVTIMAMKTYA